MEAVDFQNNLLKIIEDTGLKPRFSTARGKALRDSEVLPESGSWEDSESKDWITPSRDGKKYVKNKNKFSNPTGGEAMREGGREKKRGEEAERVSFRRNTTLFPFLQVKPWRWGEENVRNLSYVRSVCRELAPASFLGLQEGNNAQGKGALSSRCWSRVGRVGSRW